MKILHLALGLFAFGCTQPLGHQPDGGDGGGDAASSLDDAGGWLSDGGTGGYTLTLGPIQHVAPTFENTQCIVVRLGNPAPIHVNRIHNNLGVGSHHMIVYRVNDTTEQPTPFNCRPFTDTLDPQKGSPLVISQKFDDLLTLPDGVGVTLDANQMIRIELHYINATHNELTIMASTTLFPMSEADFKDEAGFLFIGDPDISIAAMSSSSLTAYFAVPSAYSAVKFFAITGHEHQLGTNVTVAVANNANDPGTFVYDVPNWLWSEPATIYSSPPFTIPAGGGFRFRCDWTNNTMQPVGFGESANAEMCFFWAYYYPNQGAKVCFHTAQTGTPTDACCPGPSPICSFFGV